MRLKSFYGKSLARSLELKVQSALRQTRPAMLRLARRTVQRSALTTRAKRALKATFFVTSSKSTITLNSSHPIFRLLVEGQKQGQMTWLLKSKRPTPLRLPDGTVIFRTASRASMLRGSWMHPGRPSVDIIHGLREDLLAEVRKALSKLK